MRQTDLWRLESPRSYQSRNSFELLVKSITAFVSLLTSRCLDGVQLARRCTQSRSRIRVGSCAMVGAPPRTSDQHVLDHRIVASYAPIAPLVTMSCRLLLRRVASRGVLPRERFSPVTQR